jgi:hypothetical protein
VRLTLRYGQRDDTPSWLNALLLAEKGWGHPEDIMRRRGSLKWAARQAALDAGRSYWDKFDRKK